MKDTTKQNLIKQSLKEIDNLIFEDSDGNIEHIDADYKHFMLLLKTKLIESYDMGFETGMTNSAL